MYRLTKIAALAAVSSMLAACGGHGDTIPAQTQSVPFHGNSALSAQANSGGAFTRVNDDGSVVRYFPTREEASRAAMALRPPSARSLVYYGGPIQPKPHVYIVFWGKLWNSTGDPDGMAPYLKSFLGGLNGSQWTSTMTQYYGPAGTYIGNTTTLAGSYVDTAHQPATHPTDAQIGAEALVAAEHFKNYTKNASYVVVMPTGHDPSGFGTSYCAYHNSETASNGKVIAYTNLPYMPDAGGSCGEGIINSPGVLDGVSIVEGHEQAETQTDPHVNPSPTGWYNNSYGEIGDECAWQDIQNTNFSTGTFPTQPLWSNKANACVQ